MESAICYEDFLKNSGYKTKLQYQQPKKSNQNSGYKTKLQLDIKLSYNINNQKKPIKTKRKGNITLFGSIYHTGRP